MKLKILGSEYALIFTDELPDGILGLCDSGSKTIRVHSELEGDRLLATLLHEFDHACDFENGVFQAVGPQIMEITAETKTRALMENFEIKLKKPRRRKSDIPAPKPKRRASRVKVR